MTITKLKAKNQITIPSVIIKRLHLKPGELFGIDLVDNYIKLFPVDIEPRYALEDLNAVDKIVEQDKTKAKTIKSGKEFSRYISKIVRHKAK